MNDEETTKAVKRELTKRELDIAIDAVASNPGAAQDLKNAIELQMLPDGTYCYRLDSGLSGSIESLMDKIKRDRFILHSRC